ncbi:hypothetical protein [Salinigranum rubrum]|uniref:hypothetical protein n=1 Tax=Salinigranum rubrum TaxID=755307 RepID=UPI0013A56042|nr:hypothetical protein [Salinigranum rubrum]
MTPSERTTDALKRVIETVGSLTETGPDDTPEGGSERDGGDADRAASGPDADGNADPSDGDDGRTDRVDAALDELSALTAAVEHADNVEDVVDELGDLAGTVDALDLLAALDWGDLPDVADESDLPVVDGDGADDDAHLDVTSFVDPSDVWSHVDVREAWRQLRQLESELEELVGEDGGGDSDDSDDALPDGSAVSFVEGSELHGETAENAIQSGVSDAVSEFREGLLDLHDRLEELYEANRQESEARRSQASHSRNPTAVSTMSRTGLGRNAVRHSTVPEETRYSSAPNRRRIYGRRFDDARGESDE